MAQTLYELSLNDMFDSRDAIERIEELEMYEPDDNDTDADFTQEDREELEALRDLADSAGSEWTYGMTFIAESYFEDYVRELAYDVGYITEDSTMESYIDWEKWANDVQMDYSSFEIEGVTFYAR